MHKLLFATLLLVLGKAYGQECKKASDCDVVRTITVCDEKQDKLRAKIVKLKRELAEKEAALIALQNAPRSTQTKVITQRVVVPGPVQVVEAPPKRHNVAGLLGTGPQDLEVDKKEARIKREIIGGLQYQYNFDTFSIGIQALTNESVLGVLGINF